MNRAAIAQLIRRLRETAAGTSARPFSKEEAQLAIGLLEAARAKLEERPRAQLGLFGGPTVAQAKADIEARLVPPGAKAIDCPVCGQRVKLYRRRLDAGMAHALQRMFRHDEDHRGAWMDYRNKNAGSESRTHTLLRHWGLVERHPETYGHWRITSLGRDFVIGAVTVFKSIFHFNNRCYGFTKDLTTYQEAAAEPFRRADVGL